MTQKSKPRPARRLVLLTAALLLSALVAIPASGVALAQSPPPGDDQVTLVNRDRQMVERKKEGDFVARPILSRQTDVLFYAIRHPDTGDWITSTYRVRGARSSSPRAGSTPSSTRPWTSSPSFTPNRPTCWCWPCRAPAAATTTSSTP